MTDHQAYHTLAGDPDDPNQRQNQLAAPQFQAQVAPSPAGYQQANSFNASTAQSPYAGSPQLGTQGYGTPGQESAAYFQHHGQQQMQTLPAQAGVASLTGQMGALGIQEGQVPQRSKKKDRHAYHTLEAPAGAGQQLNGTPFAGAAQYGGQNGAQNGPDEQHDQQYFGQGTQFGSQLGQGPPQGAPLAGSAITSAQGRVDPEQIPSVPRSRDAPAHHYLQHIYPTMESHLPPPAIVPFVSYDQGLPLGMILQPLAPLQEGEQAIPLLDFGETGPPRCSRCRTYINPFMTFRSGGNKFICNMCTYANDVPSEYFSPTDPSGVRVDRLQRPELTLGTVEFTVPKEYWVKEPVGIRWLFLIDVTAEACNKGFLAGFCEGILNALYGGDNATSKDGTNGAERGPLPPEAKVAIVTFDKEMHFYNLNSGLDKAQMIVMPDIEEPFVPLSEGLFVDPQESRAVITDLLTQLPAMFQNIKNPEPALLPALNAVLDAMEKTGGKITCSLSALSTWGPGRLYMRDDQKTTPTPDAEKKLLTTEHALFKRAAARMVELGIGIDFFLAAPNDGYLDIATLGHVSATTGGQIYYYPTFHNPRDTLRLSKEIKHTVTRETGYQALMKVRCSNGLQISAYHGNFTHHTFGADLEFGTIDADKAIGVMFNYDGKLDAKLDAHFQAALLYTSTSGQRRVRCINLVSSVSDAIGDIMRFVDQDAAVQLLAKEAASKVSDRALKDIRASITERSIDILAGYRKNASGSHPPGQLVLPENLKEFSMYTLGLIKSRAFKGGRELTDRRIHDVRLVKSMGPVELSLYLYPRIISIHNLDGQDGFPNESGHLRMPDTVRATFSKVDEGGAYLVDNGQICLLWLHAQVSPNLLEDLFGPGHADLKDLNPFMNTLPVLDTHLNAQVRNILQYMDSTRGGRALTIQLARQGLDGAQYEFARLLYEDRNNEAQSYVDWLVHLHRTIQLELSGQRKREDTGDSSTMAATFAGLRTPYWG